MKITDLEGTELKITDLEAAIAQAEEFMSYHHMETIEGLQRLEERRQQYWQDIYNKLIALRESNNS